jgi:hypothetical protein
LILVGTLLMLYCGNSLTPAINKARDAGPAESARFDSLHKRSVWLNAIALLIGISLIMIFATRSRPMTSGIIERPPGELSEGQQKLLRDSRDIDRILGDPATLEQLRKAMESKKPR